MRHVDSHEIHLRARAHRARAIHAAWHGILRSFGQWLGAASLQARRALRLAG